MVFESVLVEVLNKFLGPYVKNLDASQLSVGIWGGDVLLNELELKETALDDLGLPIRIFGGYLGKLRLKIPWKNLYGAPVVAEVDGLYVLAGPAAAAKYDPKKAANEAKDAKNKELKKIETARKKAQEPAKEQSSDPGFVEKLVTQIIKNVQITVRNIHISYEDAVTNPSKPFSCGVTLDSLFVQSTNSKYEIDGSVADDPVSSLIYKLVQLNCLSVYWNSDSELMGTDLPKDWKEMFRKRIARPDSTPSQAQYIVHPISAEAKLQLTLKAGQDMNIPQALVQLVLNQITIALDKQQYQDVMGLVESLDRMVINKKYLKYKPSLSLREDRKGWWRYAITAVLEEDVKRRTRMWSWEHMKQHRQRCRRYTELYTKKLITPKSVSKEQQAELDALEVQLDIFTLTLCRQLAENKAQRHKEEKREKAAAAAQQSWSSWASSWITGGGAEKSDVKPPSEKEIQAEKDKLYRALGYSENVKAATYPKEYVSQKLEFRLKKVSLKLTNEKGSVADVSTHQLDVDVSLRSSASGVGVALSVKSVDMIGHAVKGSNPPQIISTHSEGSDPLLAVNFDLNPLNSKADQQIGVKVQPIRVVYDADTVDAIIGMFLLPKDVQLQKLSAGAASTLADLKTQTRAGLEHAINQRKLLDVDIAVKSPYLIVPQNGTMENSETVLVVDLGALTMKSDMKRIIPDVRDASYTELEDAFYDRFDLGLSSVQVIVARASEDWNGARTQSQSPFHLLRPIWLDLSLQKSLLPNDTKLANIKVHGSLPEMTLDLSDHKIKQVLEIVQSLPLPPPSLANKPKAPQYSYKANDPAKLDTVNFVSSIAGPPVAPPSPALADSDEDEWFDAMEELEAEKAAPAETTPTAVTTPPPAEPPPVSASDEVSSSTKLELKFDVHKVGVLFNQHDYHTHSDSPLLHFNLEGVSSTVTQTTWDLTVGVTLDSLAVEDHYGEEVKMMLAAGSVGIEGAERLLELSYKKIDTSHPQYTTTLQSTQQLLNVEMSAIGVHLSGDSLANLMAVAKDITKVLKKKEPSPAPDEASKEIEPATSTEVGVVKEESSDKAPAIPGEKLLHLTARLKGVAVTVSDFHGDLLVTNLSDLGASVVMFEERMEISVRVNRFNLLDKDPNIHYSNVISCMDMKQDIVSAKVVLYKGVSPDDVKSADVSISAGVRRVQVVVVFRFLNRVKNFATRLVRKLKLDQETVDSAKQAATSTVSKTADALKEKSSSRIKLSVKLEAPMLILPLSATSQDLLIVDLGRLTLSNNFTLASSLVTGPKDSFLSADNQPAIVDQMSVAITSVQLGRGTEKSRDERGMLVGALVDHMIVKPLAFSGEVDRSLSGWCKAMPAVNVKASLGTMEVKFSPEDFHAVMSLLDSMKDGKEEEEEGVSEGKTPGDSDSTTTSSEEKGTEEEKEKGEAEKGVAEGVASSEIRVFATVGVNLLLHSEKDGDLMAVSVQGLSAGVTLVPDKIKVEAGIADVSVTDLSSGASLYPKILSVAGGQRALSAEVVLWPNATKMPPGALDVSRQDLSVCASLGQLKVVVLFLFLNRVLDYLKRFNVSEQAISSARESARKTAEEAVSTVQEQHKSGTRIKLDVSIEAPEIVIPLKSDSDEVILADLGKLKLSNSFFLVPQNKTAIAEAYDIKLSDLQVSRTNTSKKDAVSSILVPFNLSLLAKRNLSASWYRGIPTIDLTANLDTLKMVASGDDIEAMCRIVTGNLKEGLATQAPPTEKTENVASETSNEVESKKEEEGERVVEGGGEEGEVFCTLLVAASLHSIEVELYKGSGGFQKQPEDCLAGLSLSGFEASTKLLNDGTMDVTVSMGDCCLDDKRPDARSSTARLITQSLTSDQDPPPPLIHLELTTTKWNESKISAAINGIQVLVDMRFIFMLLDFLKTSTRALQPEAGEKTDSDFDSDLSRTPESSEKALVAGAEAPKAGDEAGSKLNLRASVKEVVLALLEDSGERNPRALVLQTELQLDVSQAKNRNISATVSSLGIASTRVNNLLNTYTKVLDPLTSPIWASLSSFDRNTRVEAEVPSLSLTLSPTTVRLVLSIMETFKPNNKDKEDEAAVSFPRDVWVPKQLDRSRWYMNPFVEGAGGEGDSSVDPPTSKTVMDETMSLKVKSLMVTVEQEMPGGHTLPVLTAKMGDDRSKAFVMTVENWSSMLKASAQVSLVVSYYCLARDVWEPILEPVMDPKNDRAPPILWFMRMQVHKLSATSNIAELRKSSSSSHLARSSTSSTDSSSSSSNTTSTKPELPPELLVQLSTENALQLTLTKSSLGLVKQLLESYKVKRVEADFSEEGEEVDSPAPETFDPAYTVTNMLGKGHMLKVQGSKTIKVHGGAVPVINHSQQLDLFLMKGSMLEKRKPGEFALRDNHLNGVHIITLTIDDYLPVDVALGTRDCSYYPLTPSSTPATTGAPSSPHTSRFSLRGHTHKDKDKDQQKPPSVGVVVEIDRGAKYGTPQIFIHSPLKIVNDLKETVDVHFRETDTVPLPSAPVSPSIPSGEGVYLPLALMGKPHAAVFVKPVKDGANWTVEPLSWAEGSRGSHDLLSKLSNGKHFHFHAVFEEEKLKSSGIQASDSTLHNLECYRLMYPLQVQNLLPLNLTLKEGRGGEERNIRPGEVVNFNAVNMDLQPNFEIVVTYASAEWSSKFTVGPKTADKFTFSLQPLWETSVDTDVNLDLLAKSDILVSVAKELDKTWLLSLFCPYWMVNKTGLTLQYSNSSKSGSTVTTHYPDIPIALYPHKNALVRVLNSGGHETSDWSKPFSLDAAGSEGVFQSNNTHTNEEYQMGTNIQMSAVGLSKLITITPRFLAYNKTRDDIDVSVLVKENNKNSQKVTVKSEQLVPFWPSADSEWMTVCILVDGEEVVSKPFKFKENSSLLLRMGDTSGVVLEVQVTASGNVLTFLPYFAGSVPVQLLNDTPYAIEFRQNTETVYNSYVLLPGMSLMYAWDDPTKNQVLACQIQTPKVSQGVMKIPLKDDNEVFKLAKALPSSRSSSEGGGEGVEETDGVPPVPLGEEEVEELPEGTQCELEAVEEEEEEEEVPTQQGNDDVDFSLSKLGRVTKRVTKKMTGKVARAVSRTGSAVFRRRSKPKISTTGFWASFRDGLQRVLLFSTDNVLRQHIQDGNTLERANVDLTLSLQSVGVSLVNDVRGIEVAYVGIFHSEPIWQEKRRFGRYKAVSNDLKMVLEDQYTKAKQEGTSGEIAIPDTELKVNFTDSECVTLKEGKGDKVRTLRRSRYEGVYLELSISPHRTCISASINGVQVDNHLPYSPNPTILYPYPLPPSVSSKYAPKPFVEASIILRNTEQSNVQEIELFQVLVQAIGVNVDMSFIMATFGVFNDLPTVRSKRDIIQGELSLTKQPLTETRVAQVTAATARSYFKLLHLSPLEVHLSFSLDRDKKWEKDGITASHSNPIFGVIITALTQFGVLIGQTKGAELKLGYFQLEDVAVTQAALTDRIIKHYVQQAALQIYRVLLGLEVLGNPVGFVMGLKDGAIGLFYHPIQGAVLGPGEFFEGLALGGRQFVGGTLGGVSGALGKVTGVLGDAAAKFSFDSEYQEGRKKTSGVEGAAKGIFSGVTGVISQPIRGAKEGGLWGLVKGTGKGVIGLVVRPTAGVFDLASATLNTIQKKTQVGDTEVSQVRPARYIGPDKVIYPYSPIKAVGYAVFMNFNNGKLAEIDDFFDYVELVESPVKAILITDHRFSFIKHVKTPISDKYEAEFSFGYHELVNPLTVEGAAIVVTLEESAGLPGLGFISGGKKKIVKRTLEVRTAALADKVKELVNQAYRQYKSCHAS